ncbi:hypothetical protein H6501_04815 [Candidatus Woesearchaeota archaeon]|nr:hypothetical protein [Nanoarchaeota archaeon]MCB9370895.1 hypothetical protein [Candidatus Woesearchaeota archaeon]USN43996.1 MAG: hypothetical protein H6500_06420 [Candidatus Woesearchaeota archaeon]
MVQPELIREQDITTLSNEVGKLSPPPTMESLEALTEALTQIQDGKGALSYATCVYVPLNTKVSLDGELSDRKGVIERRALGIMKVGADYLTSLPFFERMWKLYLGKLDDPFTALPLTKKSSAEFIGALKEKFSIDYTALIPLLLIQETLPPRPYCGNENYLFKPIQTYFLGPHRSNSPSMLGLRERQNLYPQTQRVAPSAVCLEY